jgi:phosphotransferase system enzyme I (PtsI)
MKELIVPCKSLSGGIAIGEVYFFQTTKKASFEEEGQSVQVDLEVEKYLKALEKSKLDIETLFQMVDKKDSMREIFDSHLQILKDPFFTEEVVTKIKKIKKPSGQVLEMALQEYTNRFFHLKTDQFFQERIQDINDISSRVLGYLSQQKKEEISALDKIFISSELTPSLVLNGLKGVKGFISQKDSYTSHAAIIARSQNIPYVTGIDLASLDPESIQQVIIDGIEERVIFNPCQETKKKYENLFFQLKEYAQKLDLDAHLAAKTSDEKKIEILANMESVHDCEKAIKYQVDGIGLFRSEFLFLSEKDVNEENQFLIYKTLLEKFSSQQVTIRLFDLGGEKTFLYPQGWFLERNPLLGFRGIRFLLQEKKLLHTQLKALLRASIYGNLRILIPMVSDIEEVHALKRILEEVKIELSHQNVAFNNNNILLGSMIEVPSSALMADLFMENCDFLYIGSNDLMQYLFALDRKNPYLSHVHDHLHIAFFRLLKEILRLIRPYKKPITLCGEIACCLESLPIFIGLGIKSFSMGLNPIPSFKQSLSQISFKEMKKKVSKK